MSDAVLQITDALTVKPDLVEKAERRAKIVALEQEMLRHPQLDIPIRHFFAPGLYLREMSVPKGAIITGKIHKTEHYCILSQGEVSVETDEGMKRMKSSSVIHSMPGAKRAIFVHEDAVWVNVHYNPSDERDIEKIEAVFVVDTEAQYLEFKNKQDLISMDGGSK